MNEKEIFSKAREWLKDELDIVIIALILGIKPRPVGSSMTLTLKTKLLVQFLEGV